MHNLDLTTDEVSALYSALRDYECKYKGVRDEHWSEVARGINQRVATIMLDNQEEFKL